MKIRFIKSSEKKKMTSQLKKKFGISNLPFLLIESGKEKIRGFTGHISKEEILDLSLLTNIETLGLYLMRKESENDIRLTIDATHLLKNQITKNIVEISDTQLHDFIRGNNIEMQAPQGNIIIKNNDDLIGGAKSNTEKVFNYVPKNRRIKK
jgi:NOL1/NOP2/fmu family ribosome biogenesis protein